MFSRNLEESVITELKKKKELWSRLENDCKKQKSDVFLAIRPKNEICFYHKGGRLFKFDKDKDKDYGFRTNVKFASVIDKTNENYLTEAKLGDYHLISDFSVNYDRIKENCKLYSGLEAEGVSIIYHKYPYLSHPKNEIVVLDIEVSFEKITKNGKENQDRIDILLFNTKTGILKFVEAKHYSNTEITSKSNKQPKVINQLKRYENQVATKKTEIIEEYKKYVDVINKIFGKKLPSPIDVENKVTLLIFGFDSDQRDGKLKEIKSRIKAEGYNVYAVGDTKSITQRTLLKRIF